MTTLSELVGIWKVIETQEVTNVRLHSTSLPSKITITASGGSAQIQSVSGSFVVDPVNTTLPVQWVGRTLQSGAAGFTGTILSYGNSPQSHPVVFTVSNNFLTCFIDQGDAPPSQWTGQPG